MSTHSNPFAQGGWNGRFAANPSSPGDSPSTYGALPASQIHQQGDSNVARVLFQFINPNPTILNTIVVGPSNRTVFKVTTDNSMPGYTTVKDVESQGVALIEWKAQPAVEIRGTLRKIAAREWLSVTIDQKSGRAVRAMQYRGSQFVWVPQNECLHLYRSSSPQPCVIVEKTRHTVNLEMTQDALAFGLLEPCVVAVTLLLSGRRIE